MEKPAPISSGTELKWDDARKAAQAILKQCDDAAYTPPEAAAVHQSRVSRVCVALDEIVSALRILRPDPVRAAARAEAEPADAKPAEPADAKPAERTWEVHLWWSDERGDFESGVVTTFPESWSAIQVVLEVAEWRDVDIGRVHCIDARRR